VEKVEFFDCIDSRGIKRQVFSNAGDSLVRSLVRPHGILRLEAADGNAVAAAIALVGQ
jgi:hypothetical protein